MSAVDPTQIPTARFEFRNEPPQPYWVLVTAHRAGGDQPVTVEMDFTQWLALAPVQYVVKLELSQKQPRRPVASAEDSVATASIPRGHIEWKDGQNWVILTAHHAGTHEPVTVQMPLSRWFALKPIRAAVADHLDNWHNRKMPKW
jgi:hypothetical protein